MPASENRTHSVGFQAWNSGKKNVHVQNTHFDHNDKDMIIIGDYVI
jgi:hypothetical protein